ncbi:hypothetical protein TYRP_014931 [Tyrophagus putrescentiae]|nr:hypothetical protein TYRP_014931 [Tyrophagus putrescentiae]
MRDECLLGKEIATHCPQCKPKIRIEKQLVTVKAKALRKEISRQKSTPSGQCSKATSSVSFRRTKAVVPKSSAARSTTVMLRRKGQAPGGRRSLVRSRPVHSNRSSIKWAVTANSQIKMKMRAVSESIFGKSELVLVISVTMVNITATPRPTLE